MSMHSISIVKKIMSEFADAAGLVNADKPQRRYLWTDAFAVATFSSFTGGRRMKVGGHWPCAWMIRFITYWVGTAQTILEPGGSAAFPKKRVKGIPLSAG